MDGFSWLHLRARRCFYLLIAMVLFLLVLAFTSESRNGQMVVGLFNLLLLVAAVGAVARTRTHLIVAASLAVPTIVLMVPAVHAGGGWTIAFYALGAAFYLFAIIELMQYVLRRDRITADKLYGAVAIYIMIAVLWAAFYGLIGHLYDGAYAVAGVATTRLGFPDLVYFSFTVLTTSGFGDITPVLMPARFVAIFEQITGVMYVAILIARLAGVYPIPRRGN